MSQKKQILVVDDHPDNREVFSLILRHHGYDVRVARDGQEALDRIQEAHPDVVLMDLAMPRMDGYRATERLTANGHRNFPILAVTARYTTRAELEPLGFRGLLRKPIALKSLLSAVNACLENGAELSWIGEQQG